MRLLIGIVLNVLKFDCARLQMENRRRCTRRQPLVLDAEQHNEEGRSILDVRTKEQVKYIFKVGNFHI